MSADGFYRRYAEKKGIFDAEGFAGACRKLARLDTYNRDELFNIGFCFVGCWLNWHRSGDLTTPRGYPLEAQRKSVEAYEGLIRDFRALLPSAGTKEAVAFLRLMINRCGTSVLHIRSMLTLEELNGICDFHRPAPLTEEERKKAGEIIGRSRRDAEEYLRLYGEILPDRGGEGQLVSYYETTLVYIDAVAAGLLGYAVPSAPAGGESFDAPPMPDPEAK